MRFDLRRGNDQIPAVRVIMQSAVSNGLLAPALLLLCSSLLAWPWPWWNPQVAMCGFSSAQQSNRVNLLYRDHGL
jgi:hypothetical protein